MKIQAASRIHSFSIFVKDLRKIQIYASARIPIFMTNFSENSNSQFSNQKNHFFHPIFAPSLWLSDPYHIFLSMSTGREMETFDV